MNEMLQLTYEHEYFSNKLQAQASNNGRRAKSLGASQSRRIQKARISHPNCQVGCAHGTSFLDSYSCILFCCRACCILHHCDAVNIFSYFQSSIVYALKQ